LLYDEYNRWASKSGLTHPLILPAKPDFTVGSPGMEIKHQCINAVFLLKNVRKKIACMYPKK